MKSMYTKRNLIFNLIQNVFVGIAITITVTLLTTGFTTAWDFILSFLKAYLINYVACLIIPIPPLANLLFKLFKIKPGSFWCLLINTILCDICYVTFISIIMFVWALGFTAQAMQAWWSVYWVLLIVGFFAGLIFGNISMWITGKIIKEKPQSAAENTENESSSTDGSDIA